MLVPKKHFRFNWVHITVRGLYITATQSFVLNFMQSWLCYNQITTSNMSFEENSLHYHADDMKPIWLPQYELSARAQRGKQGTRPHHTHSRRASTWYTELVEKICKTRNQVRFHKSISLSGLVLYGKPQETVSSSEPTWCPPRPRISRENHLTA